jgi:hypothetical protein
MTPLEQGPDVESTNDEPNKEGRGPSDELRLRPSLLGKYETKAAIAFIHRTSERAHSRKPGFRQRGFSETRIHPVVAALCGIPPPEQEKLAELR